MDFRDEFTSNGESVINGGELLDKTESIDEWLVYVSNNTSPDTLSADWVLTDTYLAVVDDEIVGIICLRHSLNDFLASWGHVGYSIRPSRRNNGYATLMLALIIDKATKMGMNSLQLSAERSNVASVRTIVKNNGVYNHSFDFEGEIIDVYVIKL